MCTWLLSRGGQIGLFGNVHGAVRDDHRIRGKPDIFRNKPDRLSRRLHRIWQLHYDIGRIDCGHVRASRIG